MDTPRHAWMVRAGNDNELAPFVEEKNAVAIGWDDMHDVGRLTRRDQFKERYREAYPEHSDGRINTNAGQVYRFTCEIGEGDYVLTYIKDSRDIVIGIATGQYEYRPELFSGDYPHIRPVNWIRRVSRDDFSASARNTLGSTLTVFSADVHLPEIHGLATGRVEEVTEEEEEVPFYELISGQAQELISDLVSRLDPYDFQDLVAGVLRAMGFRAVSSSPGPDKGIDILAHPDALGFGKPRIKVQVKHRKDKTGGHDMRSFVGSLRNGDSGTADCLSRLAGSQAMLKVRQPSLRSH